MGRHIQTFKLNLTYTVVEGDTQRLGALVAYLATYPATCSADSSLSSSPAPVIWRTSSCSGLEVDRTPLLVFGHLGE
jgi:hypothetical protein